MISGNDSAGRYKIADALRSWQPVPPRRTVVLDIYTVVLTQNTCAIECWHSDSWIDHQSMVTLRGIRIRSCIVVQLRSQRIAIHSAAKWWDQFVLRDRLV